MKNTQREYVEVSLRRSQDDEVNRRHPHASTCVTKCLAEDCDHHYKHEQYADAEYEARMHCGTHGGLYNDDVEIVILDTTGRELERFHAYHDPDIVDGCPECGEPRPEYLLAKQITCPECGYIPERHRA